MNGRTARRLRRQAMQLAHMYADRPRMAKYGRARIAYRALKREHRQFRSGGKGS